MEWNVIVGLTVAAISSVILIAVIRASLTFGKSTNALSNQWRSDVKNNWIRDQADYDAERNSETITQIANNIASKAVIKADRNMALPAVMKTVEEEIQKELELSNKDSELLAAGATLNAWGKYH